MDSKDYQGLALSTSTRSYLMSCVTMNSSSTPPIDRRFMFATYLYFSPNKTVTHRMPGAYSSVRLNHSYTRFPPRPQLFSTCRRLILPDKGPCVPTRQVL